VQVGDILLVNRNAHLVSLRNGDLVKVLDVTPGAERASVPVKGGGSVFSFVTGIEAFRTGPRESAPVVIRQTFGVATVIQYAPDMPNGFIIITSYPRN
jgi:hypothetical protein